MLIINGFHSQSPNKHKHQGSFFKALTDRRALRRLLVPSSPIERSHMPLPDNRRFLRLLGTGIVRNLVIAAVVLIAIGIGVKIFGGDPMGSNDPLSLSPTIQPSMSFEPYGSSSSDSSPAPAPNTASPVMAQALPPTVASEMQALIMRRYNDTCRGDINDLRDHVWANQDSGGAVSYSGDVALVRQGGTNTCDVTLGSHDVGPGGTVNPDGTGALTLVSHYNDTPSYSVSFSRGTDGALRFNFVDKDQS